MAQMAQMALVNDQEFDDSGVCSSAWKDVMACVSRIRFCHFLFCCIYIFVYFRTWGCRERRKRHPWAASSRGSGFRLHCCHTPHKKTLNEKGGLYDEKVGLHNEKVGLHNEKGGLYNECMDGTSGQQDGANYCAEWRRNIENRVEKTLICVHCTAV